MELLKQLIAVAVWVVAVLVGSHFFGPNIATPIAIGILLSKVYSKKECKDGSCDL